MFKQFRTQIDKQAEDIIKVFLKPNTEKTLTLANDLRQHVLCLREKIDTEDVEIKIHQMSDELCQLESDLIIAEDDARVADAKVIQKTIDERAAEMTKLCNDLERKYSDVINSRTLSFKATPFLESLSSDIEHYELTQSNYEIFRVEITDLIDYLKDVRRKLQESIVPTVSATARRGTTHPTNIARDLADYILPEEIKGESGASRGAELYEYARGFKTPKEDE